MYRIAFFFFSGLMVIGNFLPLTLHAEGWEEDNLAHQSGVMSRQESDLVAIQDSRRAGRIDRNFDDKTLTNRNLNSKTLDRYQDSVIYRDNIARNYDRYNSYSRSYTYPTNSYYGTYGYGYPSGYSYSSYSTYPVYPNAYIYPSYGRYYYYNPGMYNPNTTFVNPPSSLNYPNVYPSYSETYIYR